MARKSSVRLPKVTSEGYQTVLPGFYEFMYSKSEINDLNKNLFADLISEINLLRVMIRRAVDQANKVENLEESLSALNALGLAGIRLARLLEVQSKLSQAPSHVMDAITQAILEMGERMGSNEEVCVSDIS